MTAHEEVSTCVYSLDSEEGVKCIKRLPESPKSTPPINLLCVLWGISVWGMYLMYFTRFYLLGLLLCVAFIPLSLRITNAFLWYKPRTFVLCLVRSVGLNPVDAKFLYGDKLPPMFLPLLKRVINGNICGIDFSGVVVQSGTSEYKPGDEVFGTIPPFFGSCSEVVWAPVDSINLKPRNLSHSQAAAIPLAGLTTYQSLTDACVVSGDHILVIGASGGTGHFAVQVGKALGARVTAVCSQRNEAFVRGLGADDVVCYDAPGQQEGGDPVIDQLRDIVRRTQAFRLVFDSVSSHDHHDSAHAYERRIRAESDPPLLLPPAPSPWRTPSVTPGPTFAPGSPNLRSSGGSDAGRSHTSVYIFLGGHVSDWVLAHFRRYLRLNLFGSGRLLFWVRFPNSSGDLAALRHMVEAGLLKVTLAAEFGMSNQGVRGAFRQLMSRRTVGKVVLKLLGTESYKISYEGTESYKIKQ